jgi:hypothetical protein
MRIFYILMAASAAMVMIIDPSYAGPKPKTGEVKLECKIVFGPGAEGKVRYEIKKNLTSFMATVEAEEDSSDVPLFEVGDALPVTIGGTYAAGTIMAGQKDDGLEGALRLETKAKGKTVKPFPSDFPFGTMAVNTPVSIGAQECLLQDRSSRKTGAKRQ